MKSGEFIYDLHDYEVWRTIISQELENSSHFEIHCWYEEPECIEMALRFGKKKDFRWDYGTVIEGDVNDEFCRWIMSIPKPEDTEIYDKMTPFFNIALDTGFWSSHYGTELTKT